MFGCLFRIFGKPVTKVEKQLLATNTMPEDAMHIQGPGLQVLDRIRAGQGIKTQFEALARCIAIASTLHEHVSSGGKVYLEDNEGGFVRIRVFASEVDADNAAKNPKHPHLRLVGKDD